MARFPITTARQELGVTPTTAVRADLDTRTADPGAAIGQAILSLGSRWYIMEADTQLSEAQTQVEQEHIRLMLELPGLDPSEHAKAYEDSIKTRQGFVPKNRMAAGAYSRFLDKSSPQWGLDVTNVTKAKLTDNMRATGFVAQQGAVQTGSFDKYFTHLAKGKILGVYDAEEVVKLRQDTLDDRERYVKAQGIQTKARQREDFDKYVELTEDAWLDNFRNGVLTENMILDSTMPVDTKNEWLTRLDKQNKAILEGKEPETDHEEKEELRWMALGLENGSTNKPDFVRAMADFKADGGEDIDYEEIMQLGLTKFRAGQAETIRGRITANKSQLVDIPSELSIPERLRGLTEAAKEDVLSLRKLQLANWDRYSKELTDYHKQHPEAEVDELYNHGQMLLTQYKRTPDELRANLRLKTAIQKHGQRELEKAKAIQGAALSTPKTKEEYDKLSPGTRYIDPEGNERIK